jgi:Fic family protein
VLTEVEPLPVPPVSFEDHDWLAETDGMTSRARLSAASGPYQSTVPAKIADYCPSISADLAADVEEASAALAKFDTYAQARLGSDNPTLGPMSSILLRTESSSSSQIENLTVGARQLAFAELGRSGSENARVVVANVRTMEAALALAERLDENAILAMHSELLAGQPGWEQHAGRYRETLVWVGTSAITPRGASHVAPQAEHVPGAMRDLVQFMRRDDIPVVFQSAVAHAQLETIHPFSDGNGRTGRAVVHAMLRSKGLVTRTTAPVSAGLLTDAEAYFDALGHYRRGDARPILEQFARASRYAASTGVRLVDDLSDQVEEGRQNLADARLRPQAAGWRVVPLLVSNPVVNARLLSERLGMNAMTAQRALTQLTEAGVLSERTGMQRNRVWQHSGILGVLDQYAQRVRRR